MTIIIQSNFTYNIIGVLDLRGVKISVFPLTVLVIVTTVLPHRAACDGLQNKIILDAQGRARRETARRHKSE